MSFTFDPHPPSRGEAFPCDVSSARLSHQSSTVQLRICFSDFAAPLSGIWRYEIEVTADSGQALGGLSVPPEAMVLVPSLSMQCGSFVAIRSRAVSGALVASGWVLS